VEYLTKCILSGNYCVTVSQLLTRRGDKLISRNVPNLKSIRAGHAAQLGSLSLVHMPMLTCISIVAKCLLHMNEGREVYFC